MSDAALRVCLKVDVDTLEGYLEGVPVLMGIFGRLGIRATFCVAMGPDRSGLAVRRVITRKGFLAKMMRTRGAVKYGWRTMLYGTLLPAPLIASRKPQLLADIAGAGHEVIPHGWDHISWHDGLTSWDAARTTGELEKACAEYERLTDKACHGFASPGWQCTERSAAAQEARGLQFAADTRGFAPFWPVIEGRPGKTLQLPTTLPTMDELIGLPGLERGELLTHMLGLIHRPPQVAWNAGGDRPGEPSTQPHTHTFTLHTEVEGRTFAAWFEELLSELLREGTEFVTLGELAQASAAAAPCHEVFQGELPGRGGTVSCQGTMHESGEGAPR
jgi:undecaprenyl phosphate-alpha-L-ara4FN deformylase